MEAIRQLLRDWAHLTGSSGGLKPRLAQLERVLFGKRGAVGSGAGSGGGMVETLAAMTGSGGAVGAV